MKDQGFEEFWSEWPRSPRKTGKSVCRAKWIKMLCWTQAETIIAHVKYMKTTPDWRKNNGEYIPMPATYLNQMRWDGAEFETVKDSLTNQKDPALVALEQHRPAPLNDDTRRRLAELRKGFTSH